jgi:hypothetical protein
MDGLDEANSKRSRATAKRLIGFLMNNGVHRLPCGATLEIRGGVPVRVSHQNNSELEESVILREAEELAGVPLHFRHRRGRRWRRSWFEWFWPGKKAVRALLVVGPCVFCGDESGVIGVRDGQGKLYGMGNNCNLAYEHLVTQHHRTFDSIDELHCDGSCRQPLA